MSQTPQTDRSATEPDTWVKRRTTLAPGTVLAGRYRIEELIGEGGMGDVYRATHLKIDKAVAIKVLAPEQMRRERTVSRFLQEAKAASKIRHENVVDITDYGESEGCAFFVMEFLAGEDLSVILKREGRMPWSRARGILVQLLEALAAAHRVGIVHRDIKPHNCFITRREHQPDFVKVIDFGIAKLRTGDSGEQLTQTGAIMGTAEYMSPEQGLGEEADGRSDLYSVGVIAYRMLTGRVPYTAGNQLGIVYQHIHGKLVPPSRACPEAGYGPQIDTLVTKALAKSRDHRFATATDFIAAIAAIPESGDARRRFPPWAGPAVAVSVALAVGLLGWSVFGPDPSDLSAPTDVGSTPAAPPSPAGLAAAVGEDRPQPAVVAPPPSPPSRQPPPTSPTEAAPEVSLQERVADPGLGSPLAPVVDPTEVPSSPQPSQRVADADRQPAPEVSRSDAPPQIPARRSSRELRSALARVASKVRACGKKAGLFPGEKVRVEIKIAPGGRVIGAKSHGAQTKAGAACIEAAVRKARVGRAQRTQVFSHVFVI